MAWIYSGTLGTSLSTRNATPQQGRREGLWTTRTTVAVGEESQMRSSQLLQQHFGCLQVSRVKALGEPAIDVFQQSASFCALA